VVGGFVSLKITLQLNFLERQTKMKTIMRDATFFDSVLAGLALIVFMIYLAN